MPKLTDPEIVCSFMEPRPIRKMFLRKEGLPHWWQLVYGTANGTERWAPEVLTLDRLHQVEAWLSKEQRIRYDDSLIQVSIEQAKGVSFRWRLLHASAQQKTAALAAVLRPEVEGR